MVGNGSSMETSWPEDIITNILTRLPVKTLTRFKCVKKDWERFIRSPKFIAQHLSHSVKNNACLLFQQNSHSFCLIGPDLRVHSPQSMKFNGKIIGSSNGLFCLRRTNSDELFLLNPAIRQIKQVPKTLINIGKSYDSGFGFGHAINDYKIVQISFHDHDGEDLDYYKFQVNRAEVFSLTTECWKEINVAHLQNVYITSSSVIVNGAIFWQANMISGSGQEHDLEFMLSFDIAQEVFNLLKAPPPPQSQSQSTPTHSYTEIPTIYNDKLAMFRHFVMENYQSSSVDLWVLEDTCAARENWIRKYSVGPITNFLNPTCFLGEDIVCWNDQISGTESSLALINPYSRQLKNLSVNRHEYDDSDLFSYVESLVPVGNIHHDQ